jgi:hypothetical protein
MQYIFQEVSVKGVKRWVEDGKKRQLTKKFHQTLNPYNRNPDGSVKTRQEILKEITKEKNIWLAG